MNRWTDKIIQNQTTTKKQTNLKKNKKTAVREMSLDKTAGDTTRSTVRGTDTLYWYNSAENPRDQTLTDDVSTSEKTCDETVIYGK